MTQKHHTPIVVGAAANAATFNSVFSDLDAAVNSFGVASELTLDAAGAVTVTGDNHTIDTLGDAATDNFDTVNGMAEGARVLIHAENAARTVVIRHGIGNITTNSGDDITLDDTDKAAILVKVGTNINAFSGGSSATEPKRTHIFHDESTITNGNALGTLSSASQPYQFMWFQSAAADADAFSFSVVLEAGDYTFYVLGFTDPNSGIIDWDFDNGDDAIAGQDWYSAGNVFNVIQSGAITLTGGGYIKVTGTVNGKNGASANFRMYLTKFWFKQAAD